MTKEEFLNELYIVKHHTEFERDQRIIQAAMDLISYNIEDIDIDFFTWLKKLEPEYPESRKEDK